MIINITKQLIYIGDEIPLMMMMTTMIMMMMMIMIVMVMISLNTFFVGL